MAPRDGVSYNIVTGHVEDGPATHDLPIFKTLVDKEGRVSVMFPKKPPIMIRPYRTIRDYNDPRKYVIVGGGEAAITCAETIRALDFTGEVIVITANDDYPINRDKLYDTIKYPEYKKMRVSRVEDIKRANIEFIFGVQIKSMQSKDKRAFILTENQELLEYDGCLIAPDSVPRIPLYNGMTTEETNISLF